jgi:hypothetical protein
MNNYVASDIAGGIERLHANSGAPMSRTRRERISASLLGSDSGVIRCPSQIKLGLKFEDTHPVDCLEAILDSAGFKDPEELRSKYVLPQTKLICGPEMTHDGKLSAYLGNPSDVLMQALMLGLCTAQIFDPDRPVLWTETSLTRVVELFDPTGFYA